MSLASQTFNFSTLSFEEKRSLTDRLRKEITCLREKKTQFVQKIQNLDRSIEQRSKTVNQLEAQLAMGDGFTIARATHY